MKFTAKTLIVITLVSILFLGVATYSSAFAPEKITITYSDWQLAQDIWGRILRESFAEFEAEHPNIEIEDQPVALGQMQARLSTAIKGGRGPDVMAINVLAMQRFINEGWVQSLEPFIEEEEDYLDDFYDITLKPTSSKGNVYGIPMNVTAMVLVFNSKLWSEAGLSPLDPPENFEEFKEYAKKLTKDTDGDGRIDQWGAGSPFAGKAGFQLRFTPVFRGFGASILTDDWKHSALDTSEAKEAFKYLVDLYKAGYQPPGTIQNDCNDVRRLLAHKKVTSIIGTMWTIPEVSGMNPDLHGWRVLEMAPIPVKKGLDIKKHTVLYEKALFMNPNTEHQGAAWELIKFLNDEKRMQRWFNFQNMPSGRKSVNETYPPILQSKYAQVVIPEIERGDFVPLTPKYPEAVEAFRGELQNALTGSKSWEVALNDAHNAVEEIVSGG